MKENQELKDKTVKSASSKLKDTFKTRDPGWSTVKSTSLFRTVNFELYARPNKYVMAIGAAIFTSCICYIAYMNMNDNARKDTYVTLDADGGTTSRPRTSKWY